LQKGADYILALEENQLHCVLGMQFQEDESRAGSDKPAENLNVLRLWALY
jgi:predicted transposase YbfD/YdcC